jgi:flagellar protein FliO/FliZ
MQNAWTSLGWFVAIVALIPLALWLLKRTPMGGAASGPGAVRTVGITALSASQKLVTVEVGQGDGRMWLVLGVTPTGINTLHTMMPPLGTPLDGTPASNAPPAAAFSQLLSRLRNPGAGGRGL